MVRITLILALISSVLLSTEVNAQRFDIPGWTYVRDLDSMRGFRFEGGNDTIAIWAGRIDDTSRYHCTTNGGRDWESHSWGWGYMPGTGRLHGVRRDSITRHLNYYVSSDFGKTFTVNPLDTQLSNALGGLYMIGSFINPHDPEDIFVHMHSGGEIRYTTIIRSKNGGKTWRYLALPPPTEGAGESYSIRFDRTRKKTWYVMSEPTYFTNKPDYHRTDDDGETFVRLDSLPNYKQGLYGFEAIQHPGAMGEGTFRSWIEGTPKYGIGWRYHDENSQVLDTLNLVSLLFPGRVPYDTATESGIVFWPMEYPAARYPELLVHRAADQAFVKGTYQVIRNYQRLFLSTDEGRSWQLLVDAEGEYEVAHTFYDEGSNTLWMITVDEKRNFLMGTPTFLHSLWKRRGILGMRPSEVQERQYDLFHNSISHELILRYHAPQILTRFSVDIYDVLGRQCGNIEFRQTSQHNYVADIPKPLSAGTYFFVAAPALRLIESVQIFSP